MNVTDYMGFITPAQERMMETAVSKRAIGVITGVETATSYVDNLVSLDDKYEIEGTTYSFVNGRLTCQDYRFQTRVRRTAGGNIRYDATTVHLPDLVSYDDSSNVVTVETVPIGTLRFISN